LGVKEKLCLIRERDLGWDWAVFKLESPGEAEASSAGKQLC